eukprot:1196100-Prorocentrum_minimum.AAC.1
MIGRPALRRACGAAGPKAREAYPGEPAVGGAVEGAQAAVHLGARAPRGPPAVGGHRALHAIPVTDALVGAPAVGGQHALRSIP